MSQDVLRGLRHPSAARLRLPQLALVPHGFEDRCHPLDELRVRGEDVRHDLSVAVWPGFGILAQQHAAPVVDCDPRVYAGDGSPFDSFEFFGRFADDGCEDADLEASLLGPPDEESEVLCVSGDDLWRSQHYQDLPFAAFNQVPGERGRLRGLADYPGFGWWEPQLYLLDLLLSGNSVLPYHLEHGVMVPDECRRVAVDELLQNFWFPGDGHVLGFAHPEVPSYTLEMAKLDGF